MHKLKVQFLVALFLPFTLILGGGIWGGTAQHTHRSADQGGVISWIPTGFVGCFAGPTPPANTLEAYGQAVSRVTYANLYGIIGTTHGAGDGVTTFNLPDVRGRVLIGLDNMGGSAANRITAASTGGANGSTLGGSGGAETHTLSIAQMPVHAPNIQGYINSLGAGNNEGFLKNDGVNGDMGNADMTTDSIGGGAAHNNTQPWLALKCVIGT